MRFAISSLLLSAALTAQVLYPDDRIGQDAALVEFALNSLGSPNPFCVYAVCYDSTLPNGIQYIVYPNNSSACPWWLPSRTSTRRC